MRIFAAWIVIARAEPQPVRRDALEHKCLRCQCDTRDVVGRGHPADDAVLQLAAWTGFAAAISPGHSPGAGGVAVAVSGIALWDGNEWYDLGAGIVGRGINALALMMTNLYAGGIFTNLGGAMVWAYIAHHLQLREGLILLGNTVYGTTAWGGNFGYGTVFSISFRPQLTITLSGTNVTVTWPTNFVEFDYTGYTLQSTTNLLSPVWATNSPAPVVVNGQNIVTNPISGTQQFFRLSQ